MRVNVDVVDSNAESTHTLKQRVRLLLSYEGSRYCGWQSQSEYKNKNSIQNILESALTQIYKEPISCAVAGRTDAGAHAYSQNIHFDVSGDPKRVPLLLALRTLLPFDICARKAWIVPLQFSAHSSAVAKTYRYFIINSEFPAAIGWRYLYWYPHTLDLEKLQTFANLIVGRHDFKSFQSSSGRPPKTSVRKIYRAQWSQPKKNLFVFEITGNGFLTQMVRNLVSCQLELHKKNKTTEDFQDIFKSQNRRLIGKPAPSSGLFLTKVYYPKSLLELCTPLTPVSHKI